LSTGQTVTYEQLISTMPLPVLIRMAGEEAPEEVQEAAAGLRHTSVKCVNIGVARERITEKHWIYYPEDTVFHRIFVQGNASPHCNAEGGFGFTCEITYGPSKPLPCDGEDLIQMCIKDAKRVGFIKEDDKVICGNVVDLPYAYVVYDHGRAKNIAIIRKWLSQHDIVLVGRYSEWEYYNSDHAFLAGKRGAEEVGKIQEERSREARSMRMVPDRAGERGWRAAGMEKRTAARKRVR
jgi:UDP-galactopyranose mutase